MKRLRQVIENGIVWTLTHDFGVYSMFYQETYFDMKVSEMVRMIDAKRVEKEYTTMQLGSRAELVNIEVRNYFYEGSIPSLLKCFTCFNYYSSRNNKINQRLTIIEYLRWLMKEDWNYIMQCKELSCEKRRFIKELYNKLKKKVSSEIENQAILIINDVVQFLYNANDYKIVQ